MPQSDLQRSFDAAVRKVVREHNIAIENLTEQQIVEAFKQAIRCGDFQRHVQLSGGQAVVYIPYAREQQLESRVEQLTGALKQIAAGAADPVSLARDALEPQLLSDLA